MRRLFPLFMAALLLPVPTPAALTSTDEIAETQIVDALWLKVRDLPADKRPKVALVLGGGGARGLAHIGLLRILEREKVPVDIVVGTSVGALVGALYTAGVPVDQIEKMAQDIGWDELTNLSAASVVKLFVREQLLSTKKMETYLTKHMGDKQFADLKKTFACVAADLKTGEQIVLREGSVALAARASATMPGLFQPVPYRHRLLVDGGIVNNVPTDVAKVLGADIILCSFVPANFSSYQVSNVLTTLTQSLYIQGEVISQERLARADVVVLPQADSVTALELWKSKECIEAGVAAGRAAMPEVRKVLAKKFFESWMVKKS